MHTLIFSVYAILLTYASLRPAGTGNIEPWDKALHFIAYAVFALLGRRVVQRLSNYHRLCVAIIVYSGVMEYLQSFIPGRSMSGLDLVANALGVVAVVIAAQLFTDQHQST
jgi:VanZ family protein